MQNNATGVSLINTGTPLVTTGVPLLNTGAPLVITRVPPVNTVKVQNIAYEIDLCCASVLQ
jgi:hypothetical protein